MLMCNALIESKIPCLLGLCLVACEVALWLGHESIETTNAYLHANLAMKERALAKVLPVGTPFRRFKANDTLLAFLESL